MLDLSTIAPADCICYGPTEGCCCGETERALRAYAGGKLPMPSLTVEQREACIEDAVYCEEGSSREEYDHLNDHDLARAVLAAYVSYCRDKGLL